MKIVYSKSPSPPVGEPALPTAGRPGGWGEGKSASINPHAVLDSLKEKHRRFETLEKEGLIAKNDLPMKDKLRQAIHDLEGLIGQLEEK